MDRPEFYRFHNGEKAVQAFEAAEFDTRLAGLRKIMAEAGVEACVFTSMLSIAYYSGIPIECHVWLAFTIILMCLVRNFTTQYVER